MLKISATLKQMSLAFMFIASPCMSKSSISLTTITIPKLHQSLLEKSFSCRQFVEASINRIKHYNFNSITTPPLNAFVQLNTNALEAADILDKYQKQHQNLMGPMHCVTVVIKDNLDSIDMPSSSGSLSMIGNQALKDSDVVKQLKDAGAIMIGTGAMDEFASGAIGVSSRSGRVGNVYQPMLNPGGSSGGVAVAVSAGFAMVGIGSDNSGSIRIPAAFNGVYGLRPSIGMVSNHGAFPRGLIDGVFGPISRDLNTLSTAFSVIKKRTLNESGKSGSAHKKKIGLLSSINGHAIISKYQSKKSLRKLVLQLKKIGYSIKPITIKEFDVSRENNMAGDVQNVNEYLANFPGARESFKAICKSQRAPLFGNIKQCLKFITNLSNRDSKDYLNAKNRILRNQRLMSEVFSQQGIDFILSPITTNGESTYDMDKILTAKYPISSNSGIPALAFPIGWNTKTKQPISVQLLAPFNHDQQLVKFIMKLSSIQSHYTDPTPYLRSSPKYLNQSIPQLNTLITQWGYQTYKQLLKTSKHYNEAVTPKSFMSITR